MIKIRYFDKASRAEIINAQKEKGLFLIEDRIEGVVSKSMYLVFENTPNPDSKEVTVESEIVKLQERIQVLEEEVKSLRQGVI